MLGALVEGIPLTLTRLQTNGIFQLNIKNKEGKEVSWVIDAKEKGEVTKGAAKKAGELSLFHSLKIVTQNGLDCTISMSDDTFAQLVSPEILSATQSLISLLGGWQAERPEAFHDRWAQGQG